MPQHVAAGILGQERRDQGAERLHLRRRVGVGVSALGVSTADQADPDRAMIEASGVGAGEVLRSALLEPAVEPDHPMIADPGPASLAMPRVDLGDADVLPRPRIGAVNDDQACG